MSRVEFQLPKGRNLRQEDLYVVNRTSIVDFCRSGVMGLCAFAVQWLQQVEHSQESFPCRFSRNATSVSQVECVRVNIKGPTRFYWIRGGGLDSPHLNIRQGKASLRKQRAMPEPSIFKFSDWNGGWNVDERKTEIN